MFKRARTGIVASVLAAGLMAGCATGDRIAYKVLAGESPGEKGTVPDAIMLGPLTAKAPGISKKAFRKPAPKKAPPAVKGATAGPLAERHKRLRAAVFGLDDEFQLRRRAIGVHMAAYRKAIDGFGIEKNKLLPENDPAYRANMATARARIARINGELLKLNALATRMDAATIDLAAFARKVKAAAKGGAGTAESAALKKLATDAEETAAIVQRMGDAARLDIANQSAFSNAQNRGLDQLAGVVERQGVISGGPPVAQASLGNARPRSAGPLVRIRYVRPTVAYEAELYRALKAALAKRPNLRFELIGVAAKTETRALAVSRAQRVMFSMAEMGVPLDRIAVRGATDRRIRYDEVRLFVR